jgi:protein SCO1
MAGSVAGTISQVMVLKSKGVNDSVVSSAGQADTEKAVKPLYRKDAKDAKEKTIKTIFVASFLLLQLLFPCQATFGDDAAPHEHHSVLPLTPQEEKGVGVTEHLGEKIPLDITFRDETGRTVRLGELITGPTIILPIYYRCTNICNFLQQGLALALPEVKRKPGEEYRVISVSFDESESPDLALRFQKTYLTAMDTPFPTQGWRFLVGDARNIHRLTDAAGYRFFKKGRDFVHPVASFIVTGDGTLVRYLYGTTFLPKDLTLALLEAQQGKVGKTIRKMVGYCFTFDPEKKSYVFNLLRVSATVVIICAGSFLAFLILTGRKARRHPARES